jgi:hypothetical protein
LALAWIGAKNPNCKSTLRGSAREESHLAFTTTQPIRRSFLGRIVDLLDRAVQNVLVVLFYHIPVSLAAANPFLRRSNIRHSFAGARRFEGGRYAIYVLWQPSGMVPWYVRNMLDILQTRGINVIAVLNHQPSPEQLDVLQGLSHTVLVRNNKGSDFGAYQDALLNLRRGGQAVMRLLLLNDSVYVFPRGLDKMISELLSDDYPVVSAYECWERRYHFQSFCIGIAGSLVSHPEFQDFWTQYRPIAIRRWRIDHGEVCLSEVLRKISPRFKVIYDLNQLLAAMTADDDWNCILKYREFFPRPIRHLFPQDEVLTMLQGANPSERELLHRRLKESLTELFMLRAQAHTGAFFFSKYLDSPLLKRDLVYREQLTLYEVERMLSELGLSEYRESIANEIRKRGTAAHLKGLRRRKHRLSLT